MQVNVENAAGLDHATARTATGARHELVLGAAAAATGLLAGLFYGYACSIMPGLHASSDRTAVEAMQNINEAIHNPVFFASFLGAPALAIWALAIERRHGSPAPARWVAAGAGLCVVGLLVTFAFSVSCVDRRTIERASTVPAGRGAPLPVVYGVHTERHG